MWEHRNNIALATNEAALQNTITNEINTIMAIKEFPPQAAYLFTDSMKEQLTLTNLSSKKLWLANYHAHVKFTHHTNTQDRGLHQMQHTMRTFLSTYQE
jgi:hypothetical protein